MSDTYTFTVEVLTDALAIVGSYDLPIFRRVSDAINSRLHRFVTLRDASVAPIWKPQQAQPVPQILVDLNGALLVATLAEPAPPPGFQPAVQPRDTQPMMFFTSAFAMRADFFKRSDLELVAMLSDMSDDFIPLSNVTIFPLQNGGPVNRDFVCLSRARIQALYAVGAPIAHAPVPGSAPARPLPPPPPAVVPPLAPPDIPAPAAAPPDETVTDNSAPR